MKTLWRLTLEKPRASLNKTPSNADSTNDAEIVLQGLFPPIIKEFRQVIHLLLESLVSLPGWLVRPGSPFFLRYPLLIMISAISLCERNWTSSIIASTPDSSRRSGSGISNCFSPGLRPLAPTVGGNCSGSPTKTILMRDMSRHRTSRPVSILRCYMIRRLGW